MFGKLGDIAGLLKSAKEMQSRMAQMQEQLAAKRFEAEAGGGMVRAIVDGKGALVDIRIDPQAASDVELLEDLVKGAVGAAVTKAHDGMKQEMSSLSGGMDIPGLSDMLGGGGPSSPPRA